jgi:hypothetical protein
LEGREEEEQTQKETEGQNTPSVEHSENLENKTEEQRQPSIDDVKQAIKRINNNRAPRPDNINGDFIKTDEPELIEKKIDKFMSKVWKQEKMPEEWEEGLISPVYKKGDQSFFIFYFFCLFPPPPLILIPLTVKTTVEQHCSIQPIKFSLPCYMKD